MKILKPHDKPWCICRLGTKPPNRIVARFISEREANRHLEAVTKFVKDGGQYVVAYDVVEVEK